MDYIKRLSKPISAEFKEPFEVGVNHVAITFDDAFASILENALPEMVKRELPFTIFVPSGYLGKNADWVTEKKVVSKTNIVMSEIQLKNLKNVNSVSIGSHSITHRDLTLIEEEDAEREILQSKKEIESIIKQNITLLSFPHGAYSDKHVELAKQAGYDRAFSILPVQIL
ncbi:MAG: polysaccharide deacetylase family protein, partial [Candidatus Aminicenantes bacterium]|nr:polysaccharide deacetylase family protein [Candidatus Aminicenantes bacterium]NIQ69708.1 polysaccharide deacetylase family protein [Candidatus Aminicenantes bacterium]